MEYEQYQFIEIKDIKSLVPKSELSPDIVYKHFMSNTDECIYVVEDEMLLGVVTVSDLQRFYYSNGEIDFVNSTFKYIDEINFGKAEKLFQKLGNVHEVPVIKNGRFVGLVINGVHRSEQRWVSIRRDFKWLKFGGIEWRKREILRLFSYVRPNIYVYPVLSEKKLKWSKEDWIKYKRKLINPVIFYEMPENEQRDFWGEFYSEEYIRSFIEECRKIKTSMKNGVLKVDDMCGRHFNFSNGYRKMNERKEQSERRIYFIGPCIIFGSFVGEKQTIEYYLYRTIKQFHEYDYDILNYGVPGMYFASYFQRLITEGLSDNDIIIYFSNSQFETEVLPLWKDLSREYSNVKMGSDLTKAYNELENPVGNIIDSLYHCNHIINERMADIIYHDIKPELEQKSFSDDKRLSPLQDYYIPWDIVQYYREFKEEHNIQKADPHSKTGAIVMNCNPFTKGHRYLVEYACSKVDRLYIFVVQEDASQFSFEERFQMVKNGTVDLDKVCVLPSGNYIISKETFEQYFDKDSVTTVQDMDYDLHIFADVIAEEFGINVRFIGEEPFDIVTKKYNETMKRILPQGGVEVVEIPRFKNEEQEIVSASLARKYINEKKYDKLGCFLPRSTIEYLQKSCC